MNMLLLHGALGSAAQFNDLAAGIRNFCEPHAIDFLGHGSAAARRETFRISDFARQVLDWMDEHTVQTMDMIGYSMGGYVALYIARHHPERVGKIMTLSTKFLWTPEIAAREAKNLEPETIAKKAPAFAERLLELHGTGWKELVQLTAEMILSIAADNPLKSTDYRAIKAPVTVMVGDSDKMVSLEETIDIYRQLETASLLVLPATGHPLEAYDVQMLAFHARRFFGKN